MEQCMVRPDVKKRKPAQPRPTSTPPKPPKIPSELGKSQTETQGKKNSVETPVAPLKPSDVANMNRIQRERTAQIPTIPARPTEKELSNTVSYRRSQAMKTQDSQNLDKATLQPAIPSRQSKQISEEKIPEVCEMAREETDFRQGKVAMLTEMFQKGPQEPTPTFTSHVSDSDSIKPEEKPEAEKPTTDNKKGGLKGMLKKANLFKSQASVETALSAEELNPENDQSSDEVEQERPSEGKLGKVGFIAEMFGGTQKEKTSVPALRVSPETSDAENVEEEEPEETKEKGFFRGFFKKPQKSDGAEEALSSHLSVSNGSLSDTGPKEKGGVLSGIFKKSKPSPDVTSTEDNISVHSDVSASDDDSLSVNSGKAKGKGGVLTGIFKKAAKPKQNTQAEEDKRSLHGELSTSDEDLLDKPKGGLKGMLKKANLFKSQASVETALSAEELNPENDQSSDEVEQERPSEGKLDLSAHREVSASSGSLSEEKGGLFSDIFKKAPKATDEKGGMFGGMFKKKSPKSTDISSADEDKMTLNDELSRSADNLAENNSTKEKGNVFSELFRKPQKHSENAPSEEDKRSLHGELSASDEDLDKPKQKGGIFGEMFKKTTKPSEEGKGAQDDDSLSTDLSGSTDSLSDHTKPKEKGGVFGGMFKKSKPQEKSDEDKESLSSELSASTDDQKAKQKAGVFDAMFKKTKLWESLDENEDPLCTELSASTNDLLSENGKTKDNAALDKNLCASNDSLSDNAVMTKEKNAGWSGLFSRSPRPALRSQASMDPLTQFSELSGSKDSLEEIGSTKDLLSVDPELSGSKDNLLDTNTTKEKKGVLGFFRRSPKPAEQADTDEDGESKGLTRRGRGLKKKRVVSFRVKRTLPREPKFPLKPSAKTPSQEALIQEEPMELQEMSQVQEVTEKEEEVEVQEVEMAPFPTEGNPLEAEGEDEGLMDWWRTVEGWDQWNETTNFKEEEENEAVEAVADRVYMAARLFVHLFNQRGASLQQRILEMLALADGVDQFHKKTISAAVGGGVASVVGSVATITGLILAPVTFGASIIVTAVGIGVATAGSITSATANITDTVHAKMDRKKVEKMIQDYQDEAKDIRECLEFVQEGMNTLEEWDFKKYTDSMAKKHLPKNIKHVVKEGGRAGKALMINTDKLISTVQVLGVAGGAAKAAKAMSVATGVMSALFLALDIFFLAKDSHDLHKGAKTKFATKIRDVCKELQDGLLELNKVKCQLQKTMDGIEVEAYEEEGEEEDEDEEDLELDPVKLAQLEQELDQIEEQLDKKVQEQEGPSKSTSKRGETEKKDKEKESKSVKEREKETKSEKERRNKSEKKEGMAETQNEISEEDRKSVKSEDGDEESVREKKEETQEEEKAETELIGETPKKDAEEDAPANSNTKESDGKSEKEELKKDKTDREVEKVEEERPTRKVPPTAKHNRSRQGEGGSARSVQSSTKEKSVTERTTQKDKEEMMKKGKEEDEAKKGEARSEGGARESKSERERKSGSANDSHRRREEDRESKRGSKTDGDLKEGRRERRGGEQKEEKGGEKRESTKSRDGRREIMGQGFSRQEAGKSRGHRSKQGEGKSASLVGRGEEEFGRRREKEAEGERRGSRQEYWRGQERRDSGQDHRISARASSGKERDGESRGSRPEHGSEKGGGEGRRGSGQEHSSEKQRSAEERSSSRRSEREARERREERAGKPQPQPRVHSVRQEGLDI